MVDLKITPHLAPLQVPKTKNLKIIMTITSLHDGERAVKPADLEKAGLTYEGFSPTPTTWDPSAEVPVCGSGVVFCASSFQRIRRNRYPNAHLAQLACTRLFFISDAQCTTQQQVTKTHYYCTAKGRELAPLKVFAPVDFLALSVMIAARHLSHHLCSSFISSPPCARAEAHSWHAVLPLPDLILPPPPVRASNPIRAHS